MLTLIILKSPGWMEPGLFWFCSLGVPGLPAFILVAIVIATHSPTVDSRMVVRETDIIEAVDVNGRTGDGK